MGCGAHVRLQTATGGAATDSVQHPVRVLCWMSIRGQSVMLLLPVCRESNTDIIGVCAPHASLRAPQGMLIKVVPCALCCFVKNTVVPDQVM